MKRFIYLVSIIALLAGCSSTNGNYRMVAYDANGNILGPRMNFADVSPSMVNKSKRLLCRMNPKSVVRITDPSTGQDIQGMSPYQCP